MNTHITIAALALTAALASVSPAWAGESGSQTEPSIKVKFRDLDLSTPKGAAVLYQRIERSARLVCTDSSLPYDTGRTRTFNSCYQSSVEEAVSSINQPLLTARHRAKTEKSVQVGSAR